MRDAQARFPALRRAAVSRLLPLEAKLRTKADSVNSSGAGIPEKARETGKARETDTEKAEKATVGGEETEKATVGEVCRTRGCVRASLSTGECGRLSDLIQSMLAENGSSGTRCSF